MKIGFFELGLKKTIVRTIFSGMFTDLFHAISRISNYTADYVADPEDISNEDVLVYHTGANQEKKNSRALIRFNGPIVLYSPPPYHWFNREFLELWKENILFAYSTDRSSYYKKTYDTLSISHLHFPFASNPEIFFPMPNTPKVWDVLFVANAQSGTGRYDYIDLLMKRAQEKNWNVLLLGKDWDKYGQSFQLISHGPTLNLLYNSAKVCINLMNNEQKLGEDTCLDTNNRLFDLAMSGVCQISNAPQVTKHYFTQEEVPALDNPQEWLEKVEYYLTHEQERTRIGTQARERALNDHTWDNRAVDFTTYLKKISKTRVQQKISFIKKLRRLWFVYSYKPHFKTWIKHPVIVTKEVLSFLQS